jgi:hypothetical protein
LKAAGVLLSDQAKIDDSTAGPLVARKPRSSAAAFGLDQFKAALELGAAAFHFIS